MADAHETITVMTDIPAAAIQSHHRLLLEEMGFTLEESGDNYYLYAIDPSLIVSSEFLNTLDDSVVAIPLIAEARKCADDEFIESVLKDILKSPIMADTPHIDLMASYRSNKARPGEHGGWAARIARHDVQYMNTADAFREWDSEPQRIKDIEAVCDLANRTAATAAEKEAVARLSDYVVNHPLVEYGEEGGEPDEHHAPYPVWEVQLPGFVGDGSTEQLILWVESPTSEEIDVLMPEGTAVRPLDNALREGTEARRSAGVDFFLPEEAMQLRSKAYELLRQTATANPGE
ncbi:hypothetical protein AB7849_15625 [Rhodanobacter sp. 115]|uniref:hypothetical protein n=1 Tax=Rhodanobacter sp. FW021-MT20 TaxID=1162282 RepID=UPI0034E3AD30